MIRQLLVVTPDRDIARMLRACIIGHWPGAEVVHQDPTGDGLPGPEVDLSGYDALLVSHDLGLESQTGLDWLTVLRLRAGTPPIIMVTDDGDPQLALNALKLGADDYLTFAELSPDVLDDKLSAALSAAEFAAAAVAESVESATIGTAGIHTDVTRVLGADEMPVAAEASTASATSEQGIEVPDVSPDDTGVLYLPGRTAMRVPGYRILNMLGSGAMAKVFVADRLRDDTKVVFKVLDVDDDQDPSQLRRFMREYKILRELRHPNVIRIFTRVLAPHYVCLVMELCEEGDLGRQLPGGLPPNTALRYLRDIAAGLSAGHERGIVHRDIKPGNILFRADGSLAVADFGAASQFGEERLTQVGGIVGTPYYLSPEQLQGHEATVRSDIYSLGVLFYEMLTGEKPFTSKRLMEIFDMHLNAPVPALPAALQRLQPLVEKLMAKVPEDRPVSAAAVAKAIRPK